MSVFAEDRLWVAIGHLETGQPIYMLPDGRGAAVCIERTRYASEADAVRAILARAINGDITHLHPSAFVTIPYDPEVHT